MTAALGGIAKILTGILGSGGIAEQFFVWGVVSGVVSTGLEPFQQELRNKLQADNPVVPLSASDLADMVVRSVLDQAKASEEAKKTGVSADDFDLLVKNTGEPPALQELLTLYRRHKLSDEELTLAIKQSRIKPEWLETIKKLGITYPSPADILDAYLKGQLDSADAHAQFTQAGGDPDSFDLLYHTAGEGPTPDQAAVMANRGIIPWDGTGPDATSYSQAFLEGRWRNKWAAAFRAAAQYYPPPRTVTAMVKEGSLSKEEGLTLLEQQGLTPTLAAAYIVSASKQKTQAQKDLTVATIEKLVVDRAISHDDAVSYLRMLNYDQQDAEYIVALAEAQRLDKFRETAINSVHTGYVDHKLGAQDASLALDAFGIPSQQRDDLLALWKLEQATKVKTLTAAEIKKAVNKSIITADVGKQRLIDMGYSADDADIYLQL